MRRRFAPRRYASTGTLRNDQAVRALTRLQELDLERWPHEPFLSHIWELRENLTAYDAAYVALAEALYAPLCTLDRRIATASGIRAAVEAP